MMINMTDLFEILRQTSYDKLVEANKSDARDNEYRRIEIMSKSETMTNDIAEFMKFTSHDNSNVSGNADMQEFVNDTNGFADTVEVTLGIENREDIKEKTNSEVRFFAADKSVEYKDFNTIRLEVPNIDFGLSYRAENFVKLEKKVKSITLKTSTAENLVVVNYDENGQIVGTPEGVEKIQALPSVGEMQGFRYINVDEDLMQGATIAIEYYIQANNIGEVDTVNKLLLEKGSSTSVASELNAAREVLYSKLVDGTEKINYTRMNALMQKAYGLDYKYGSWVGGIYYKGTEITQDEANELAIVPLTVQRIIDWVDNDATFETSNNSSKDKYWVTTTEKELLAEDRETTAGMNKLINVKGLHEEDGGRYYKDEKGRKYTTEEKKNIVINVNSKEENPSLIVPIYPEIAGKEELQTKSYITIEINSVLGAGEESDDMVYENIAEIAQFNTIVGRRTNFAATIGNINLTEDKKTPYEEAFKEPDSTGTELVSLIPPTGLTKYRIFMAENGTTIVTILVIILLVITAGIVIKRVFFTKKFYK